MDYYLKIIQKYLRQTATIFLHSSPNFILETFLTIVIFLIYIYQHLEISRISRRVLRLRPHTILCRANTGTHSRDSLSTSVTHYQRKIYTVNPSTTVAYKRLSKKESSELGWILPTRPTIEQITSPSPQINSEKRRYADQLVALTPEQFVKIDKERKLREKEMDNYMSSLSTLCKNVMKRKFSERTLNHQVEMVREGLECNKMSLEGKYLGLRTDAMTRSLFCLLEHLITGTSLKDPLPFKGDITALAMDVAELSQNTPVDKWDVNSSGCISDVTDDTELNTTFKEGDWKKEDKVKTGRFLEKFV